MKTVHFLYFFHGNGFFKHSNRKIKEQHKTWELFVNHQNRRTVLVWSVSSVIQINAEEGLAGSQVCYSPGETPSGLSSSSVHQRNSMYLSHTLMFSPPLLNQVLVLSILFLPCDISTLLYTCVNKYHISYIHSIILFITLIFPIHCLIIFHMLYTLIFHMLWLCTNL